MDRRWLLGYHGFWGGGGSSGSVGYFGGGSFLGGGGSLGCGGGCFAAVSAAFSRSMFSSCPLIWASVAVLASRSRRVTAVLVLSAVSVVLE